MASGRSPTACFGCSVLYVLWDICVLDLSNTRLRPAHLDVQLLSDYQCFGHPSAAGGCLFLGSDDEHILTTVIDDKVSQGCLAQLPCSQLPCSQLPSVVAYNRRL
jgi:hypothetical protein